MGTIETVGKDICTGCTACKSICPKQAITMELNSEGFYYPIISKEKCVNCSLCQKVCPALNKVSLGGDIEECYAAMADTKLRMVSSSGGVFSLLAEKTFSEKGAVSGAIYENNYQSVTHIVTDKIEDLPKLRGSKYVQSYLGNTFEDIKKRLNKGQKVMFVGCPCQVAGLNKYLQKSYQNLLTVDLICHGANSLTAYRSYISEVANGREIAEVNFREKDVYGWSTPTTIKFKDGSVSRYKWDKSQWNLGFNGIINRECCGTCYYATKDRVGDITLGDFWQIDRWDKSCNDWKGTSIVIVNSKKGKQAFESIKDKLILCKEAPLDFAAKYNGNLMKPNKTQPGRKFFFSHLDETGYHKALWYGRKYRYDVGLVGWWFASNYGSVLTYFALGKILEDMGKLAIMIRIPRKDNVPWEKETEQQIEFMKKFFPVSKPRKYSELHECNKFCDSFMLGSDQLWVKSYINLLGYTFFLDFVDNAKKKIAYSTSLGYDKYDGTPYEIATATAYCHLFNAISVREESGIDICKKNFDIDVQRCMDPIFMCDRKYYDEIASMGDVDVGTEPYILCYILDPTREKQVAILHIKEKLNLNIKVILDLKSFDSAKDKWNIGGKVGKVKVEDFVNHIKNCNFMITDSLHGTSMAMIYQKNFISISNSGRGKARFDSLFKILNLKDRLVENVSDILINDHLIEPIDYERVNKIIAEENKKGLQWLTDALNNKNTIPENSIYQQFINHVNDSKK